MIDYDNNDNPDKVDQELVMMMMMMIKCLLANDRVNDDDDFVVFLFSFFQIRNTKKLISNFSRFT